VKKLAVLLFAAVFALAGCGGSSGNLAGYMIIEGDKLYLDEVEIITTDDEARIAELKLEPGDMPGGYYIHNPDNKKTSYDLTDKTTFTFVDTNELFIKDRDGKMTYTTDEKDEFIQHLEESYYDSPPAQKVPFFIQVKDGKVINVEEKIEFTI